MMGKLDLNDSLVSPFFVLASGVQAGLFSLVLFGIDFASPLVTFGSGAGAVAITLAKLVAILALGVAFVTNKPEFDKMGAIETWTAIATLGLVLAPPFSPLLQNLIQQSTVVGLVTLIIQSAGFYSLSYLG